MGCGASAQQQPPLTASELASKPPQKAAEGVQFATGGVQAAAISGMGAGSIKSEGALGNRRRMTTTGRVASNRDGDLKRRAAISAEKQHEADEAELAFTPKSIEVAAQLTAAFLKHPLFEFLAPQLLKRCVDAMVQQQYAAGERVITQGSAGDNFYIVSSGTFEAFVEDTGAKLQDFGQSDAFGELALLYDSPRACSVRATADGICFGLGRQAFRKLVMQHNGGIKHGLERHLATVPILKDLTPQQHAKLADVMETQDLADGEYIVSIGDNADRLYLILSGEVVCHREGGDKELQRLQQGDFFGESALGGYGSATLPGSTAERAAHKRLANVVAVGAVRVASLSAYDLEQVLGPLTEALVKNFNLRVLNSVPLLNPLTPIEKEDLLAVLHDVECEAGHTVIAQGSVGTSFYLIKSGSVQVYKEGEDANAEGGSHLLNSIKSGGYFGERALLTAEPCSATVITAEPSQLMTLDKAAFERVLGPLQALIAREVEQREAQAARLNRSPIEFEELQHIAVLGEGSFGRVRLVVHEGSGDERAVFALKSLYKGHLIKHKQVEHVVNEKRVLATCDHPFILKLVAVFATEAQVHMLLEVALGGELFTRLRMQGKLVPEEAMLYSAMVTSAFSYLHARHIAHRDLKPENLLFDRQGYLKLIDFGFAKTITERTWTLCGTPEYLAPEIISNQGHDVAADWWTVGILLYEMLVGRPPFVGDTPVETYHLTMRGKYKLPLHFPRAARSLISKLLVHQPALRLGSMKGGAKEVCAHEWFETLSWGDLERRRLPVMPFVPEIENELDTSYFDEYEEDQERAHWAACSDTSYDATWRDEFGSGVRC